MSPIQRAACLVLVALALAAPAAATSFVPVADRDLAAQADVIAVAEVVAVEAGPADRAPATDYLVAVDQLVQGHLAGGTIVVRVPGGIGADGLGLQVEGAPRFAVGEAALLFLQPGDDGTYSTLHLMLGAFHARMAGDKLVAEQDLSGAVRLSGLAHEGETEDDGMHRDLGRFVGWLADRAAGVERPANYWVRLPGDTAAARPKAYTYFATSDGAPARWFGFESGVARWRVQSTGMPGLGLDGTVAAAQAALDAWTADPTSAIQLRYDGTTTASGGLASSDGTNAFLFGDPHGTIPGKFDCRTGGALAIGGSWFWASTRDYRGKAYHEIQEADVVVNDGAECFLAGNASGAAEAFTHELGHALGFGHATDPKAVMWPTLHDDGRGAQLGDDDRTGASVVYGDGSYQPPAGGGGEQTFTLAAGATTQTTVELSWTPLADVATFRVDLMGKRGTFKVLATVPGGENVVTIRGLRKNQRLSLRITALRSDASVASTSNTLNVRTKK